MSEEAGRGRSLAARLRASVDQRRAQARQEEEQRRARLAEAQRERALLLRDLAAFGREVGHLKVSASDEKVLLRYEGRDLAFQAQGEEGEVLVSGTAIPEGTRLQRNAQLGRWALHLPAQAPRLFFDAGLEELLARALGLRAPAE